MEEAAASYRKALAAFEVANSDRGQAMVWINSGRIDRLTNRFDDADDILQKAITVLEQKGDIDNLLLALNEFGSVCRERGDEKDWDRAEQLYRQSLSLSEKIGRYRNQADNWEDLCVLYEHRANALRSLDNESAEKFAQMAREAAGKVDEIGNKYGYNYFLAKKEGTLADLSFGEERYEDAFNLYFEACRLMVRAKESEGASPILGQRRYEEMVDRLQEHLQSLPTSEDTRRFAELMLKRYKELDADEQKRLSSLNEFLLAADDMATKVSAQVNNTPEVS
jgi:tetratricopeptide (TPR) repeat protein